MRHLSRDQDILEEEMRRKEKSSNGFTLLEVVTVIFLLAIMAAAVSVKFLAMDPVNVNSETDTVKSHIRYAQSRAMNTNTIWGINISSTNQYSLFRNGSTTDIVKLPGQDSLTVTLPTGVTFSSSSMVISFDTWGKPYTDAAATSAQSSSRTLTLSYGSSSKSITITQNTGFIP